MTRSLDGPIGGHEFFSLLRKACFLCCGALPTTAWAQLHALPFATVDYQYTSNLFALPKYQSPYLTQRGLSFADHDIEERTGGEVLYDWRSQEVYANVEARHFDYARVTSFDHNELLSHAGVKWKMVELFDGVLDYQYERNMVPTLEFSGTELFIQRQNFATASINLQIAPAWRLESQGQIDDLFSPRPGFTSLSLTEDSIYERLRFAPLTPLRTSVDFRYLKGHFNGDEFVIAPRYSQTTIDASAKYALSAVSTFEGAAGYTRRFSEGAATVGGATGFFSYERQVTAKTGFDIRVSRAVNTYVTYQGTEIDTSAAVGATWHATDNISITPRYSWTYSTFPEGTVLDASLPRKDHYQLATLSTNYQALNWLLLKGYAQYETRRSDVTTYSFNRTFCGIGIEVRLSGQADAPYQLSLPD